MNFAAIEAREWQVLNRALWEILPRYGLYGPPGDGDFVLLERHAGACSHSVHFSRIDFVTPALIGEIQALLRRRFRRWEVYFTPVAQLAGGRPVGYLAVTARRVEAHWDAARLIRRFGKSFVWGRRCVVPLQRAPSSGRRYVSYAVKQRLQWRSLYSALSRLLAQRGTENPFGEGDYWIVDENYGGWDHKLYIHRMAFLTPALALEMRSLLRARFPDWSILVQIAVRREDGVVPPEGLRIRSDAIETHWNSRTLRKIFAADFAWPVREASRIACRTRRPVAVDKRSQRSGLPARLGD